jgi:hypothetical protein
MGLLIGTTPVSAQPMEMGIAGHCQSNPAHNYAPMPLCCLTPDGPLTHTFAVVVQPSPNSFTLSKAVNMVRLSAALLPDSSINRNLSQRNSPVETLRPPGVDFRCRNSLNSEEPPLV